MTAIGILSLFIGVLGILLSSLVILGSVQIEQSLGDVETSLRQTSDREFLNHRTVRLASETESELNEARALILPDGIVSACLSAWLTMMGIGTLLLRPWARWGSISWSMTCFVWVIVVIFMEPVEFNPLSWFVLLYPVILLVCFSQRNWRDAYARHSTGTVSA
jgi:hypothetical protein